MPWAEKCGKKYIVRDRDANGKRYTLATVSKDNLKRYLAKVTQEKELLNLGLPNFNKDALEALVDYLKEHEKLLASTTNEMTQVAVSSFIKQQNIGKLSEINRQQALAWRAWMLGKYEVGTVSVRMRELRKWTNKMGISIPWKKGDIPKAPEAGRLLTEVLQPLLRSANTDIRHILLFALNTAMRPKEILNMRWEHFQGEYLAIPVTKNKKPRLIYLNTTAREQLGTRRSEGQVFEGWTLGRFRQAFRRIVARSGVKGKVRLHDARHTWTTLFFRNGGTLGGAKAFRGDSSIASLNPYLHELKEHLKSDSEIVQITGQSLVKNEKK